MRKRLLSALGITKSSWTGWTSCGFFKNKIFGTFVGRRLHKKFFRP
jgi:hypothetical protein